MVYIHLIFFDRDGVLVSFHGDSPSFSSFIFIFTLHTLLHVHLFFHFIMLFLESMEPNNSGEISDLVMRFLTRGKEIFTPIYYAPLLLLKRKSTGERKECAFDGNDSVVSS